MYGLTFNGMVVSKMMVLAMRDALAVDTSGRETLKRLDREFGRNFLSTQWQKLSRVLALTKSVHNGLVKVSWLGRCS